MSWRRAVRDIVARIAFSQPVARSLRAALDDPVRSDRSPRPADRQMAAGPHSSAGGALAIRPWRARSKPARANSRTDAHSPPPTRTFSQPCSRSFSISSKLCASRRWAAACSPSRYAGRTCSYERSARWFACAKCERKNASSSVGNVISPGVGAHLQKSARPGPPFARSTGLGQASLTLRQRFRSGSRCDCSPFLARGPVLRVAMPENSFTATMRTLSWISVVALATTRVAAQQVQGSVTVAGGSATDVVGTTSRALTIAPALAITPDPRVALRARRERNALRRSTMVARRAGVWRRKDSGGLARGVHARTAAAARQARRMTSRMPRRTRCRRSKAPGSSDGLRRRQRGCRGNAVDATNAGHGRTVRSDAERARRRASRRLARRGESCRRQSQADRRRRPRADRRTSVRARRPSTQRARPTAPRRCQRRAVA